MASYAHLSVKGGKKRKNNGEQQRGSNEEKKAKGVEEEKEECVFIDILDKSQTQDVVLTSGDEHPVVVLTGVGSTGSVCLKSNFSGTKKIRLRKKNMKKPILVSRKVYDRKISKFYWLRCKLCKKEAGPRHLRVCDKVCERMGKRTSEAERIRVIGDLFDTKD